MKIKIVTKDSIIFKRRSNTLNKEIYKKAKELYDYQAIEIELENVIRVQNIKNALDYIFKKQNERDKFIMIQERNKLYIWKRKSTNPRGNPTLLAKKFAKNLRIGADKKMMEILKNGKKDHR